MTPRARLTPDPGRLLGIPRLSPDLPVCSHRGASQGTSRTADEWDQMTREDYDLGKPRLSRTRRPLAGRLAAGCGPAIPGPARDPGPAGLAASRPAGPAMISPRPRPGASYR